MMINKTLIEPFNDQIVMITHQAASEVTARIMASNLDYIKKHFPDNRLLLINHTESYSVSYDALLYLKNLTWFKAIASFVPYPEKIQTIKDSTQIFLQDTPFECFPTFGECVQWLMRHL